MRGDSLPYGRLVTLLLLIFVALPICASVYMSRDNPYAAQSNEEEISITNEIALRNWLPAEVHDYTLKHLKDFAKNQEGTVDTIRIAGPAKPDDGNYSFNMALLPADTEHGVRVVLANFGGVISSSVLIDGQQQVITVSDQTGDIRFTGIDFLVSQGLSNIQANHLQNAFEQFNSDAYKVTIDTSTVTLKLGESGQPDVMSFDVQVNNRFYSGTLNVWGLTAVQLLLSSDGQQVFDSGRIE